MNQQRPPQPETIVIECSAQNAIRTSDSYDEWEVSIPPVELQQGDEIGVNQSFLEARGTSTEILEFSSSGRNQNNKQRIFFEYYASDDGTNDKNKGRDWMYWGTGQGTIANPALHETAKTYKPCKAIRYDHLLEESLINANGNELLRTIEGQTYQAVKPTDIDPRVANAFSINYKEDVLVAGLFNSVNSSKEVRQLASSVPYVGRINTDTLSTQDRLLTFTDNIVNLDGLEYWELTEHAVEGNIRLKTPFMTANTNYMASYPVGTVLQFNWMPKRRQMSVYDYDDDNADITYDNYQQYPEISSRVGPLCGHFLITDNNIESVFVDNGVDGDGTNHQFGYQGKKCIETLFTLMNPDASPNIASFKISNILAKYKLTEVGTGVARIYANPWTTQSKINLLDETDSGANLLKSDPCPVNLMIRKSPLYIGSNTLGVQPPSGGLTNVGRWRADIEGGANADPLKPTDPGIEQLFPKQGTELGGVPLYLGSYHKQNLKSANTPSFLNRDSKLPFNQLGLSTTSTPVNLVNYWSPNNYKPIGFDGSIVTLAQITPTSTTISIRCVLPSNKFRRLLSPEGTVIVVGRGTAIEEMILLGRMTQITSDMGVVVAEPTRYDFEILARNINENMTRVNITLGEPNDGVFDPTNPVLWLDKNQYTPIPAWTYDNIPFGTKVEWWDWREAKTLTVELNLDFDKQFPKGLPITKNTSYWGNNEPAENLPSFSPSMLDNNFATNELKNIYDFGYQYFLYFNRMSVSIPAINGYDLPCNQYEDPQSADFFFGGTGGFNRGVWTFGLTQSLFGNSDSSTKTYGVLENPSLTNQVQNSSDSTNASSTAEGWTGRFNPHIPIYTMNFDFEISLSNLDSDGHNVYERNFYVWTADMYAFRGQQFNTPLIKWSNQGLYYYLGWIPLCNQIDLETTKDYLTPTDLSNFWTESLHKSTDIKCLFDGNTIQNSKNRGVLQNSLLMPIYGSWGNFNYPKNTGLLNRDFFTFPQTGGFAIGSVCFIDGHEMPTDWDWDGPNATAHTAQMGITQYIYPRSPYHIVHLFQDSTNFAMPTFTDVRNNAYDGASSGTYLSKPTVNYLWRTEVAGALTGPELYPVAPSGKSNNLILSNAIPNGTDAITDGNLSYTAPPTNQKGEPAYSLAPRDTFDLFTKADGSQTDYPFTGATTQREDAVYRETQAYPLNYYRDLFYTNYLKFSQYLGCDNMTLTYNENVSAFEYQFLHQPFATSFNISGGQGSGGDNAVRIFDNIPSQVSNWERYSGINVRNWATPIITKGQFTYAEIQNRPEFLDVKYPNGINPETDLDLIGDRFMNKLGFLRSQYSPRTGNMLKGIDGIGLTPNYPNLYTYEPSGTTGADTDIADAIINTSISAEDNPNSEAHNGLGQLIFYPSAQDTNTNNIRHTGTPNTATAIPDGVRYDFSYSLYGQRGGLKTANHNKAMGYPNVVGTPQVEDVLTFPRTLNPDGEQRSGYTIQIGSSSLRALTLPIKLTDGYYYILCPDLIDDPQFYITANNGSVIPAIAIVSKTYVSGDFYTTFQSPIKFYCKRAKTLTSIKVQIRNSSMGVPSNLGSNSSVIFSINRFNPQITMPPMDTTTQQTLDYSSQDVKNQIANKPSVRNTINDIRGLAQAVLQPNQDQADYIGGLQQRINQLDIPNMNVGQRNEFYRTPEGQSIHREMVGISQLADRMNFEEAQPNDVVMNQQIGSDRLVEAIGIHARESLRGANYGSSVGGSDVGTVTTDPLGNSKIGGDIQRDIAGGVYGETAEAVNDPEYGGSKVVNQVFSRQRIGRFTDGRIATFTKNERRLATKPIVGPGLTKAGQKVFFTKPVRRHSSGGSIPSPKVVFDSATMEAIRPTLGESLGPLGTKVIGEKTGTVQTTTSKERSDEREKVVNP